MSNHSSPPRVPTTTRTAQPTTTQFGLRAAHWQDPWRDTGESGSERPVSPSSSLGYVSPGIPPTRLPPTPPRPSRLSRPPRPSGAHRRPESFLTPRRDDRTRDRETMPQPRSPSQPNRTRTTATGNQATSIPLPTVNGHWSLVAPGADIQLIRAISRLEHKLTKDNYQAWVTVMQIQLELIELFGYCTGEITRPNAPTSTAYRLWKRADGIVRSILTSNMSDELIMQVGQYQSAHEIWTEARRICVGQSIMDFTLTMYKLMHTAYSNSEDVATHIAKMREFKRNLTLIGRPIPDDIFAAFLRLSMPSEWNFVFAGLPDAYTSIEVERRIREEYAQRQAQASTSTAYAIAQISQDKGKESMGNRKGKDRPKPKPGEPFCTNCRVSGHWLSGCWSKGGGAEGKGPKQRSGKQGKEKQKEKEKVNEVANSDSESNGTSSVHSCFMTSTSTISHSRFGWILDGGASTHVCNNKDAFATLTPIIDTINTADSKGSGMQIQGRGDVYVIISVTGRQDRVVKLTEVAYCPTARDNIMSESRMDKRGFRINKENGEVTIINCKTGKIAMEAYLRKTHYIVNCALAPPTTTPDAVFSIHSSSQSNLALWHRRFAHLSEGNLRHLARHKLITGFDLKADEELPPCEGCAMGKHPRAPFPKQNHRSENILDILHMDLQGPFDLSIRQYRYVLAIVDDHSRKGFKEYLHKKSDAARKIMNLVTRLETLTSRNVKIIQSDGGGEFIGDELKEWMRGKGITRQSSTPDTPQQNGIAERFNRTTHEKALASLHEAQLSNGFWPEAHEYALVTCNMSPSRILHHTTPDEVFFGSKPDASTLRVFGSRCHVRISPEHRKKLDAHSIEGIFCGFERNSKAYRIWIPQRRKFIASRDVLIYECVFQNDSISASSEGVPDNSTLSQNATPKTRSESPLPQPQLRRSERVTRPSWIKQAANIQKEHEENAKADKAKRESRAMKRRTHIPEEIHLMSLLNDPNNISEMVNIVAQLGVDAPNSYQEATRCAEAQQWQEAMISEMEMLERRKTFIRVDLPSDRNPIGCRWTYTKKLGPDGNITRYKARLVAQGFSQIPGIDFDNTFAPTVRIDSLRIILHLAASYGWSRGQDDVTGAFLHSKIDTEIYMKQPPGFHDGTNRVLRLLLGLYGLKQASRLWNDHMNSKLVNVGYHRLDSDNAVYVRCTKMGQCILAIHVDNFLSFADAPSELKRAQAELHSLFEMTTEDPNWIMGFQLIDEPRAKTISISHRQYISTILKRFNMEDCNTHRTPVEMGTVLSIKDGPTTDEEAREMQKIPYRELTGALIWISVISRPDIAFAASHLAQFNANPGHVHWTAAKRVLRYLAGTKDLRLTLGLNEHEIKSPSGKEILSSPASVQTLVGYSDSDWGRDIDDRRSVSGYIFRIGGSTVSWNSKKQPTVATSSTEAEYMAIAHASKHGLWLHQFLVELGLDYLSHASVVLRIDNKGAIDLSKDSRNNNRTKHIDIKHHFVRERVADKTFTLEHCSSRQMVADGLTKPLGGELFSNFVESLGLTQV